MLKPDRFVPHFTRKRSNLILPREKAFFFESQECRARKPHCDGYSLYFTEPGRWVPAGLTIRFARPYLAVIPSHISIAQREALIYRYGTISISRATGRLKNTTSEFRIVFIPAR